MSANEIKLPPSESLYQASYSPDMDAINTGDTELGGRIARLEINTQMANSVLIRVSTDMDSVTLREMSKSQQKNNVDIMSPKCKTLKFSRQDGSAIQKGDFVFVKFNKKGQISTSQCRILEHNNKKHQEEIIKIHEHNGANVKGMRPEDVNKLSSFTLITRSGQKSTPSLKVTDNTGVTTSHMLSLTKSVINGSMLTDMRNRTAGDSRQNDHTPNTDNNSDLPPGPAEKVHPDPSGSSRSGRVTAHIEDLDSDTDTDTDTEIDDKTLPISEEPTITGEPVPTPAE